MAKGFSRSLAPTGAGQKVLLGEPSVRLHLESLCPGLSGSLVAGRHGRPALQAGLAFGVTPEGARPQSSPGAVTLEIRGTAGLGVCLHWDSIQPLLSGSQFCTLQSGC